jgi:tyrosine-protein phosphatase SIW14
MFWLRLALRLTLASFLAFATCVVSAAPDRTAAINPVSSQKLHIAGIRDAGEVDDFMYRGAQPKDKALEELKKLGVETIVDLRAERRGLIKKEGHDAEALGIQFVNIPGNGWSNPSDEQVAQFFTLLQQAPGRRVFVHCWLGGDRAGVLIAAYRIAFDGWTADQAIREMRQFHFNAFWHPNMTRYVRNFPARLARTPSLESFRHSTSAAR